MRWHLATHWRSLALAVTGVLVAGYLAVAFTIGGQVDRAIAEAQSRHAGDPVGALLAVASSTQAPLAERNRAIWALGQLGDPQALPTLEQLRTRSECDHASSVCQHEVIKAIDGCSGAFNASAVVWRHGKLAVR